MRQRIRKMIGRSPLRAAIIVAAICCIAPALSAATHSNSRLVPRDDLNRLGLTRAWFSHVRLNPARNHVERAVLSRDRLTVLTSAGVVQEFNAQTGETLWSAPIGNENYPSLGPAVNDQYVAIVNGSTLYVLDRTDGRPVIIRSLGGAPGAGPALSETFVYVPLVKGRMEGYPLSSDKKATPWFYQSSGRAMVTPLATPKSIIWTTDNGDLHAANTEKAGMRFRLETGAEIVAPPAYLSPFVYVTSAAGELFAGNELTGRRQWKYATGFPIERAPAPIGKRVYVTSSEPALHCIDTESGNALWETPGVAQFAAASKARVYGVDAYGSLVALDSATGTLVGSIARNHAIKSLVNDQTDRVYLVSDDGVIECLRETDAKEPFFHNPKPVEPKPPATEALTAPQAQKPAPKAALPDATSEPPAGAETPAAAEKPPGDFSVEDKENPFGQ